MADPIRGEIWVVELGSGVGHEQMGRRPALVVSIDPFNSGPAELVMTVPVTSQVGKSRRIAAHVPIQPPEGGLRAPGVILCDQLRTLSKQRLVTRWGDVSPATLSQVEAVIRFLLGL